MARGTQHRKQRPTPNARVANQPKAKSKKPKHDSWEDQLFFSRLRNHAKSVFVLLVVVFAFSFVLFGVGSGPSGISDALSNLFNGSSSQRPFGVVGREEDAPRIRRTRGFWRELATALTQQERDEQAPS